MTDIIFSAQDIPSLAAAAAQMGFWDAQKQEVIENGVIPGGGSWFYNYQGAVYTPTGATTTDALGHEVPVMEAQPGVWGRLRHNGDPAYLPTLPPNSGITLYTYSPNIGPVDAQTGLHSGGWTSDGVTLAPAWVADVGVIA